MREVRLRLDGEAIEAGMFSLAKDFKLWGQLLKADGRSLEYAFAHPRSTADWHHLMLGRFGGRAIVAASNRPTLSLIGTGCLGEVKFCAKLESSTLIRALGECQIALHASRCGRLFCCRNKSTTACSIAN